MGNLNRSLTVMNEVMSTIAAITDGGEDPHEHMVQQILARFATKIAQQKTQIRIVNIMHILHYLVKKPIMVK